MALPVTISADVANQNSYHGPFKSSGSAFYTILVGDTTSTDGDVEAHKATDPTSSFSEQDGANRPVFITSASEIASLWSFQDGDNIHVVGQNITTLNNVFYARFNMSSDAWQNVDGAGNTESQIENVPAEPTANACTIAVLSGGTIRVAYQGDTDMVMGSEFERIDANFSDDDGVNWDGPTSIDNGGGQTDWTGCVMVPGKDDRVHVFFKDDTDTHKGYQRRINSDDSLETFPSEFDLSMSTGNNYVFGPGVSYDDGGTQRVRCPYFDGTGKGSVAKCDSEDTPTVTTDVNVTDNAPTAVNGQIVAALAVDTKNLQLLYSNADDTSDLYRDTNDDDAGWGTDTEELDGITCNSISPRVYDRSGTKLAFIYDDGGTVKYNEIDLAAAGPDQTLTATATGVAAIQLFVSKTLAVSAVASAELSRTIKKQPFTATAVGVATVATLRTAFVTAAAVATGVVALARKMKIGLSSTATGIAALQRKSKITLKNTALGVVDIVVNTLEVVTEIALTATATAVVALQLKTRKGLAATSIGVTTIQRKIKIGLAPVATGVVTLQRFISKTLTATATGVAIAQRKVKISLSNTATGIAAISFFQRLHIALSATATGIADLTKKAKLSLENTATGVAGFQRKIKITLENTATGVVAIVVNALEGATLIALAATATAVAALNITVKKTLGAVTVGVATLDPIATFRVLLAAVGTGIAILRTKTTFRVLLEAIGTGIAALTKIATFRLALSATATGVTNLARKAKLNLSAAAAGVASINRTIFKTLRSTAESVATIVLVTAAFVALAVVAVGIPTVNLKVRRGLNAAGSGVAKIQRTVRKTLSSAATGIAILNEEQPRPARRLQKLIVGFFGGPGGGPGR